MRILVVLILIMSICATQVSGFEVVIDGVLDESVYTKVTPLKGEISLLYLVPMADALYIGVEVEDASPNTATPNEFWNCSCVEVWFDWGNNDSATFDKDDQQFWFCPVKGAGDKGYAGQWHRASDNIADTIYDYANLNDMIDMAFVINKGDGYVIEARIDKKAMGGYITTGVIGFDYSADKGAVKYEWEEAMLGGNFYEIPSIWPDLEISEVLAVQPGGKLSILWGKVKIGE